MADAISSLNLAMEILRGLTPLQIRALILARVPRREVELWELETRGASYDAFVLASARRLVAGRG
jgi:hypothetical protein